MIFLDAHAPAAPVAFLAARHIESDVVLAERESGGHPFEDRGKHRAM
jgi:hypothetical protein